MKRLERRELRVGWLLDAVVEQELEGRLEIVDDGARSLPLIDHHRIDEEEKPGLGLLRRVDERDDVVSRALRQPRLHLLQPG